MIYGRFIIGDSISVSRGSQIKSPFHGQITQKTPSISYYDKMEQKNCFQASRARNAVEKKNPQVLPKAPTPVWSAASSMFKNSAVAPYECSNMFYIHSSLSLSHKHILYILAT